MSTQEGRSAQRPVVVAHVVATLDCGGIERWLLELARYNQTRDQNERCDFRIVALFRKSGSLGPQFHEAGASTHCASLVWWDPIASYRRLVGIFKGLNCNVVHCHADFLSGFVLPAAWWAGCKCRIAHVHNTEFQLGRHRGLIKWVAGLLLRASCRIFATSIIGCARAALCAFGVDPEHRKAAVVHCSVPLESIRRAMGRDRNMIRDGFGWDLKAKVVLHVGRHGAAKNLEFALKVFREASALDPCLHFALAGSGELTERLKETVAEMGLDGKVEFLGARDDVFDLMVAADVLLFPSVFEGLPVTVVEAQACSLPVLMSTAVTNEVIVVPELVESISLRANPSTWAQTLLERLRRPRIAGSECLAAVERTDFNLSTTHGMLCRIYR